MTKGHRLLFVTFFPVMGSVMLWILFDTSSPETRARNAVIGLVSAVASLLAGRAFIVWVQRKGLRRLDQTRAGEAPATDHSGSKSALFAASAFGVVLGPLLLQLIPVNSALLLYLVCFSAFMTGWGIAPDLLRSRR